MKLTLVLLFVVLVCPIYGSSSSNEHTDLSAVFLSRVNAAAGLLGSDEYASIDEVSEIKERSAGGANYIGLRVAMAVGEGKGKEEVDIVARKDGRGIDFLSTRKSTASSCQACLEDCRLVHSVEYKSCTEVCICKDAIFGILPAPVTDGGNPTPGGDPSGNTPSPYGLDTLGRLGQVGTYVLLGIGVISILVVGGVLFINFLKAMANGGRAPAPEIPDGYGDMYA